MWSLHSKKQAVASGVDGNLGKE